MKTYDLIIVGAGPAGSSCAIHCAEKGLKVLMIDSSRFPRDKVCGDCLNPSAWPVLERLGLSSRVQELPNSSVRAIRFSVAGGHTIELPLSQGQQEVVVRRREFDALLTERAQEEGVEFQDGTTITSLQRLRTLWEVTSSHGIIGRAPQIVAADGRNSTVARYLRMLSAPRRDDRVGLQTHIPHPAGYGGALEMHLYHNGYGGIADLGNGIANLCLVSNAGTMRKLRKEAEVRYQVSSAIAWRSISPISRSNPRSVARDGVYLCGDAARVVEPFTGEGIAFALQSGTMLAKILSSRRETALGEQERKYIAAHKELYRGKLWVNHLTRLLSQNPRLAHFVIPRLLRFPGVLSGITNLVLQ
ncbi:MAG: NAD(P)/FAD-dependent oxidoreductase [bacterium]